MKDESWKMKDNIVQMLTKTLPLFKEGVPAGGGSLWEVLQSKDNREQITEYREQSIDNR